MAKNDEKIEEAETTKVKSKEKPAPAPAEEAETTEGLVKMHKDGESLHVHPTTVVAHKAAGWKHA